MIPHAFLITRRAGLPQPYKVIPDWRQ